MEEVRREHLGSAYMEEPRRSHTDTVEEMELAAVGVRGGRRWESRSTSRPAFMVSKAAHAAVWEDLKDIKPPMYQGWYNTVRVLYCIVAIQYCNVMYCISNFSDKVVF